MQMTKKALLITYYWPPAGGIAVVRWVKFVKYLRDYGWEPIVFTVSNGSYPVLDASIEKDVPEGLLVIKRPIWEPYNLYRFFAKKKTGGRGDKKPKRQATLIEKISIWVRSNFFIPDGRVFWIKPSITYLTEYLSKNKIDALISTGPPHSAHLIASALKKKFDIPWLADFRDPWTTMDYYRELLLTRWADEKHHRLEREVINDADAVIVVGRGMKEEFEKKRGREVVAITNGFDDADFYEKGIPMDQNFSLVHMGSFLGHANPTGLWQAMAELKAENHAMFSKLKIKLIGRVDPSVLQSIKSYGLYDFLAPIVYLPHNEAVRQMRSAQILLLCVFEKTKFVLTGKLFEYLAARRPILCIGPVDGDAGDVIRETKAGEIFPSDGKIDIKQHLVELYQKFEMGQLNLDDNKTDKYSHKQLTKQVADQLEPNCDTALITKRFPAGIRSSIRWLAHCLWRAQSFCYRVLHQISPQPSCLA